MAEKTKYEIAQIIQCFLPKIESQGGLSGHQRSILNLLSVCKTAALGGHKERCDHCDYSRIHYNSCGNRNCPLCQAVNKEKCTPAEASAQAGIHDRQHDLLPVKYFHCVFTIPSELYVYFRYNKKRLYDLLFRSVRETLLAFGYDAKHGIEGKIGAICILHTPQFCGARLWTQQMTYHPHLHCIVPAAGLTKNGTWNHGKSKGNFLFPVRGMSRLFRGKLLAGLHYLYKADKLKLTADMAMNYKKVKNSLYKKEWIAYAKKAFGGPDQVLEYLGRYTHKICISNFRILKITQTHVTFRFLDRKAKKKRIKTVKGTDFVRLFAEHILPKRFVKIRHIGILSWL